MEGASPGPRLASSSVKPPYCKVSRLPSKPSALGSVPEMREQLSTPKARSLVSAPSSLGKVPLRRGESSSHSSRSRRSDCHAAGTVPESALVQSGFPSTMSAS